MKICLIGEFSGVLDEAMRISSLNIFKELKANHEVLALDLVDFSLINFCRKIKNFRPDIIHYLNGPTIKSFILVFILKKFFSNARTIISAMRPVLSRIELNYLLPFFKPDMVLAQSIKTKQIFQKVNIRSVFLFSGIDLSKFRPLDRKEMRLKYGVQSDKFVVLHVGSIKEGRNLRLLGKLQKKRDDIQVVVVARMSNLDKTSVPLLKDLEKSGCMILRSFFKNIEEVYNIADCYVFPTSNLKDFWGRSIADSIEFPLSVLEAMACNIPVISCRFGALSENFSNIKGLYFINNCLNELNEAINLLQKNDQIINTREVAEKYSWTSVVRELEAIYLKII